MRVRLGTVLVAEAGLVLGFAVLAGLVPAWRPLSFHTGGMILVLLLLHAPIALRCGTGLILFDEPEGSRLRDYWLFTIVAAALLTLALGALRGPG